MTSTSIILYTPNTEFNQIFHEKARRHVQLYTEGRAITNAAAARIFRFIDEEAKSRSDNSPRNAALAATILLGAVNVAIWTLPNREIYYPAALLVLGLQLFAAAVYLKQRSDRSQDIELAECAIKFDGVIRQIPGATVRLAA